MNAVTKKDIQKLVTKLITTGKQTLDDVALKSLKHMCRLSDDNLTETYQLLIGQLHKKHAEMRLAIFRIISEFFSRSHLFRTLLLKDLRLFLQLTLGIEASMPLPPPKAAAESLRETVVAALEKWTEKYGPTYAKLSLAYEWLESCKQVDFTNRRAQSEAERVRQNEEEERVRIRLQSRLDKLHADIQEHESDILDCLVQVTSCFEILLPSPSSFFIHYPSSDTPRSESLELPLRNDSAMITKHETSAGPQISDSIKEKRNIYSSDISDYSDTTILVNSGPCLVNNGTHKQKLVHNGGDEADSNLVDCGSDKSYSGHSCSDIHDPTDSVSDEQNLDDNSGINQNMGKSLSDNAVVDKNCEESKGNVYNSSIPRNVGPNEVKLSYDERQLNVRDSEVKENNINADVKTMTTDYSDGDSIDEQSDDSDISRDDSLDPQLDNSVDKQLDSSMNKPLDNSLDTQLDSSMNKQLDSSMNKPLDNSLDTQLDNSLDTQLESFDDDDDDDEDCADSRIHGFINQPLSITISLEDVRMKENADNHDIVETLRELMALVEHQHLPRLNKWLKEMSKVQADDGEIKNMIDIKMRANEAKRKFSDLNITPCQKWTQSLDNLDDESDEEDFEEVPEKVGYEPVIPPHLRKEYGLEPSPKPRLPQPVKHSPQASTSKEVSKLPTAPNNFDLDDWENPREVTATPARPLLLHSFWHSKEAEDRTVSHNFAALKERAITFAGTFQPVKWSCRAPLANGQLCPRMDRYKCPFHGLIIARDNTGKPRDKDVTKETALKEAASAADWDDPELQADIEAALNIDLGSWRSKGKGRGKAKGQKRKYPELTDLNAANKTSRARLKKKVFNKTSLNKVSSALDKADHKKHGDKFANQFNYMLNQ